MKSRSETRNRITCIFAILPGYFSPGLQENEVMLSASVRLLRPDRIRYKVGGVSERTVPKESLMLKEGV
jgi:hypothetical protein